MKTLKTILITLLYILYGVISYAQNPITNLTASYRYPDLTNLEVSAMSATELQMEKINFTLNVTLGSISDISKIAVLLGTSEGSSDIFYKEFEYNVNDTFDDGTSYSTTGNLINIGMGPFAGSEHYYVEVIAIMEDESHSESARVTIQ
jgi:hypothetical protein